MKLLQVDDFLKNKVLRNLETNKSETHCAFFENILDLASNEIKSKLALLNIEEETVTYLTFDFEPYGYFFNDDVLVLKVKYGANTQLYSYDLLTKQTRSVISFPFDLKDTFILNDEIYFAADIQQSDQKLCALCSQKGPFYQEGVGVRAEKITALFKSSYDGKDIKLITSLDMDVDQVDFDGPNKSIMFTVFKTEQLKPIDSDVYTYDMEDETLTRYTNGHYRIGFVKSMTADQLIFTGVDLRKKSRNDNQQVHLINKSTMTYDILGPSIDRSNEICAVITDSSCSSSKPVLKYEDAFYHIRVENDRDVLYKTDLEGRHSIIETGLKKIDSYRVTKHGILMCGLKDLDLHELYLYKDQVLKALTSNNKWLKSISLSKAEKIVFEHEGIEIEGYVFKPVVFDESKKYPAVMLIHGGPKMIYSDVFIHDVQMLCANGYFVYIANPIGSDGRGDEFSDIRGCIVEKPYEQLMQFTDIALESYPQIDDQRLGVGGGSYGGLMTNYIITQTTRFKAALSERGISSMITAFTSSDIGYKFAYEYMGNIGDVWQEPDVYLHNSPIMNANKVTTPTLFIHGKSDYRCHYTESLNMYGALNYLGVESKFCLFEGENHSLSGKGKPKSRKRRYEEILSWFNNYLKEESLDGIS